MPRTTSLIFLIVLATQSRQNDDSLAVQLAIKQARCLANCYVFDEKAPESNPYHCEDPECQSGCSHPCYEPRLFDDYKSADACKETCFTQKKACRTSCDFIGQMDNITAPAKADLPQKITEMTLNGSTLSWKQKNDRFYTKDSDSSKLAVIYLVLKAEIDPQNFNPSNEAEFSWRFASRTHLKEISLSSLSRTSTIQCNSHYVLKVAAVNKYGFRSYGPISEIFTSEELGVPKDSCVSWCHPIDCPIPLYCGNQTKAIPINMAPPLNRDDDSLIMWNDNCFDLEGSRNVTWNASEVQLTGDYCYSIILWSNCDEMPDRVYFLHKDQKFLTVDRLKPDCTVSLGGIAGSQKMDASELNSDIEFSMKTESPCGPKYTIIDMRHSDLVFNTTIEKYVTNITWRNPPTVPVDEFFFSVLSVSKGIKAYIPRRLIPVVDGTHHIYSVIVALDPDKTFRAIVSPSVDNFGRDSTALTIETPALEPPVPINVTLAHVPGTTDLLLKWIIDEDKVNKAISISGFIIMYYPKIDGNVDTVDESMAQTVQLNDSTAREYVLTDLEPSTNYVVKIKTVAVGGKESEFQSDERVSPPPVHSKLSLVPIVTPTVCALVVVIIIIVVVSVTCVGREKKQYELRLHQLELAAYHPPHLAPCFDPTEPPDEWEIDPENLNLLEILGEGFFGIVLKGEVTHTTPANESPSTPRRLGSRSGMPESSSRSKLMATVTTVVACKMLKEDGTTEDQMDLLKEVKLMKKIGQHKHIVSMLGCITRSHPICLIVEYCAHGDLQKYLRAARPAWLISNRRKSGSHMGNRYSSLPGTLRETEGYMEMSAAPSATATAAAATVSAAVPIDGDATAEATPSAPSTPAKRQDDLPTTEQPKLSPIDLLSFCRQIALGMEFLSAKGLVHRDLACRNVLVDEGKLLKISDFGLTRAVYKDATYTQKTRSRLPLKWMSIEAITDRVFTVASDVWSFGVVMWEICTLGGFPYPTISNEELLSRLRRGYRMERPENCSEELYSMLIQCWHPDPEQRPLFSVLVTALDKMLEAEQPNLYVDLNFSATNPFWLSISELSEAESDEDPEIPFQETHLRQVSFDEENPNTVISMALRAARDSAVFRSESESSGIVPRVSVDGYVEPQELVDAFTANGGNGTGHTAGLTNGTNGHSVGSRVMEKALSNGRPDSQTTTAL